MLLLGFLVPQVLAQDRNACALLLFPTKALAQDQRRALQELVTAAFGEEDAPIIGVRISSLWSRVRVRD